MLRMKYLCFTIPIFFSFVFSVYAEKISFPYRDFIKESDLIVIGKVQSIVKIENIEFAKVEVIQTFKGNSPNTIYFLASRTWSCDSSNAVVGETAMFFLVESVVASRSISNNLDSDSFCNYVAKAKEIIGDNKFYRLFNSGDGRLPFEIIDGTNLIIHSDFYNELPDFLIPGKHKYHSYAAFKAEDLVVYTKRILSQTKTAESPIAKDENPGDEINCEEIKSLNSWLNKEIKPIGFWQNLNEIWHSFF